MAIDRNIGGAADAGSEFKACLSCGEALPEPWEFDACPDCVFGVALLGEEEAGKVLTPSVSLVQVGNFEVGEELGRGGMGVVYRATQLDVVRTVALKMVLAGQLASEEAVQRFRFEAETAAQLNHPNILPVFEVGEHEGLYFYTMPYVEHARPVSRLGLATVKASGPEQAQKVIALAMAKVAGAISYAHERGVVHRDLKPANILLDANDEPFVADFGLAKLIQHESSITLSNSVLGSPGYLSPEQVLNGTKVATTASDIYGLGAILYELLTGRSPFVGATTFEVVRRVVETEPVPPRRENPSVHVDLETICMKCLRKEPDARYHSALDVREELERFYGGEPILARRMPPLERFGRWYQKHRLVVNLSGSVALLLALSALLVTRPEWLLGYDSEASRPSLPKLVIGSPGDSLGFDSATDGQLTVVGAPRADGEVRLCGAAFVMDTETGELLAKLEAPIPSINEQFGYSVAIQSRRVVVGAPARGNVKLGSVYVFDLAEDFSPVLYKELMPFAAEGDLTTFGDSVSLDGDRLIVGAMNDHARGEWQGGSAYAFDLKDPDRRRWKLFPESAGSHDVVGRSVALQGDRALIGAPGDGPYDGASFGSVFLYDLSETPPVVIAKITAPDGQKRAYFGNRVALDGDLALIGAPRHDFDRGKVYQYDLSGDSPVLVRTIVSADRQPVHWESYEQRDGSWFGSALEIQGSFGIIGAINDSQAGKDSGAVYIFDLENGEQVTKMMASVPGNGTAFGRAVSANEQTLVVGVPGGENHSIAGVVERLNMPHYSVRRVLSGPGQIQALGHNYGVLSVEGEKTVEVMELGTGAKCLELRETGLAVSFQRAFIESGSCVALWNGNEEKGEAPVVSLHEIRGTDSAAAEAFELPLSESFYSRGYLRPFLLRGKILGLGSTSADGWERLRFIEFGNGAPRELAQIISPLDSQAWFGSTIASASGRFFVGAPKASESPQAHRRGAVFVYDASALLSAGGEEAVDPVAKLEPLGPVGSYALFGRSMAVTDSLALVGAPGGRGSSFLFDLAGHPPRVIHQFHPPEEGALVFGSQVCLSPDGRMAAISSGGILVKTECRIHVYDLSVRPPVYRTTLSGPTASGDFSLEMIMAARSDSSLLVSAMRPDPGRSETTPDKRDSVVYEFRVPRL